MRRPPGTQPAQALLDADLQHDRERPARTARSTIVVDPRVSEQAERATLHLQIKAGTDAALLLGWTKVVIDEGLYDKDFVRDWCVGFEELSERVAEYPLERVAEITGVPAEQIAEAARMYANADGAVIPWTPITDQQIDSTSSHPASVDSPCHHGEPRHRRRRASERNAVGLDQRVAAPAARRDLARTTRQAARIRQASRLHLSDRRDHEAPPGARLGPAVGRPGDGLPHGQPE